MSNNLSKHVSLNNKTKSALERIDVLEKGMEQLTGAIGKMFLELSKRTAAHDDILEVVGGLFDEDKEKSKKKVLDGLKEQQLARQAAQTEAAKAALQARLDEGSLVIHDVVDEGTLLVGNQYDKDGNPVNAPYFQVRFEDFFPEVRDKVLGQAAGASIELDNGGKLVIDGVYREVDIEETPAETPAETPTEVLQPLPAQLDPVPEEKKE